MFENILTGINGLLQLGNLVGILFGLTVGIIFGALPGFSATMGVAVFVPFSFWLPPDTALLMLSGVYCGAIYGGSLSAILLGIPGTPASVPTTYDGVPLVKKGEAGKALSLVTFASSAGGFISSLALLAGAPLLAVVALKVGPPEQMTLAIFGLSVVCMLSADNLLKGLIVGFISLVLATVGQDPIEGFPRFTFGFYQLIGGVPLLPVLIGVFSLPEVFKMIEEGMKNISISEKIGSLKLSFKEVKNYWSTVIRSALIGIGIGIIPAAGPDIASFIAYNETVRASKNPEKFGKGAPEGIIASEAANNGVTGGSLIPLLTLSIPGSPPAAVFLGALFIHGLRPGPTLFTKNVDIVYTLLVGFALINILMYFIGLAYCKVSVKVLKTPMTVLIPVIMVLTILGSYAVQVSMFDVGVMLISGIIGYIMLKNNFPVSPIALALILGPMLEQALEQSLIMFNDNLWLVFTRPIAVLFILFTFLSLFWPVISKYLAKSKKAANAGGQ
ncbi:MAG: tripartite tricarboxylate transporter permease [Peptococcaceae bacterium]